MKHFKRWLAGAVAVVVAVGPMVAANPSVQHYIATHPAVAAYVPVALGVVRAAYKAYAEHAAAG